MWKFWKEILMRTPAIAWDSAHHGEAILALVLFVIALFNPIAGEQAPHWLSVHPVIPWLLVGIVFVRLAMMAVYEKYEKLERQLGCEKSANLELLVALQNKTLRAEVLASLGAIMVEGQGIYNRPISVIGETSVDTAMLQRLVRDWTAKVYQFIELNLSTTDAALFKSISPAVVTDGSDYLWHATKQELGQLLANLAKICERVSNSTMKA